VSFVFGAFMRTSLGPGVTDHDAILFDFSPSFGTGSQDDGARIRPRIAGRHSAFSFWWNLLPPIGTGSQDWESDLQASIGNGIGFT